MDDYQLFLMYKEQINKNIAQPNDIIDYLFDIFPKGEFLSCDLYKITKTCLDFLNNDFINNYSKNKQNLIHVICMYGFEDIIKYIVDKGVNLELEDEHKCRPIHYVCKYSSFDVIKHIVEKNIDLECETIDKFKPIHYVCIYQTHDVIEYFVNKGVNLESETQNKYKPIHYVCIYHKSNTILFVIDQGVDLEAETTDGNRPIHFICIHSTHIDVYNCIISKGISLECTNRLNYKPIHLVCKYSTFEIIKLFIDMDVKLHDKTNERMRPIDYISKRRNNKIIKKYIIKKMYIYDFSLCFYSFW